MLDQPEIKEK